MIIRRFIPYKGEGQPEGAEDQDWKKDPFYGNYMVLDYKRVIDDKSEEAQEIRKKIKTRTSYLNNLTNEKCEKCGSFMEKYSLIQHPKANRLGWTFRYVCSNNDCMEERLTRD